MAAMLIVVMLTVSMTGCFWNKKLSGDYTATVEAEGLEVNVKLTFYNDGKVYYTVDATEGLRQYAQVIGVPVTADDLAKANQVFKGTYKVKGKKVYFEFKNIDGMSGNDVGKIKGDKIIIAMNGSDVEFVKD